MATIASDRLFSPFSPNSPSLLALVGSQTVTPSDDFMTSSSENPTSDASDLIPLSILSLGTHDGTLRTNFRVPVLVFAAPSCQLVTVTSPPTTASPVIVFAFIAVPRTSAVNSTVVPAPPGSVGVISISAAAFAKAIEL